MIETWTLKKIGKKNGKEYLYFDVDGKERNLYREGLQVKFALGGYEEHGINLAIMFEIGMSFTFNPENFQVDMDYQHLINQMEMID